MVHNPHLPKDQVGFLESLPEKAKGLSVRHLLKLQDESRKKEAKQKVVMQPSLLKHKFRKHAQRSAKILRAPKWATDRLPTKKWQKYYVIMFRSSKMVVFQSKRKNGRIIQCWKYVKDSKFPNVYPVPQFQKQTQVAASKSGGSSS